MIGVDTLIIVHRPDDTSDTNRAQKDTKTRQTTKTSDNRKPSYEQGLPQNHCYCLTLWPCMTCKGSRVRIPPAPLENLVVAIGALDRRSRQRHYSAGS